ncbi:MAG: ArsR/SmtB family transcription factor [Promethearchaeia archaeon]
MTQKSKEDILSSLKMCRDISDVNTRYKNLREIGEKLRSENNASDLWNFCNALGNKTRLNILKLLSDEELCVCEIEVILNKSQPAISHHLRILEKANLIRGWKKGKFTFYVFNKEIFKQGIDLLKNVYLLD